MEKRLSTVEEGQGADLVASVLEAIDGLLDAMEGLEAPITRELLGTAMMALVHECGLTPPRGSGMH